MFRSILLGCLFCCCVVSADLFAQTDASNTAAKPAKQRIVTLDRARQSLQLAKLAAEKDLLDLSLRAVRESLAGGPPLSPLQIQNTGGGISTTSLAVASNETQNIDKTLLEVYQTVAALVSKWEHKGVEPDLIYETLREVVLPAGREDEIFLYAPPLQGNATALPRSQSLGRLLVAHAKKANKIADLKHAIAQRVDNSRAAVPGYVLASEIAFLEADEQEIAKILGELAPLVRQTTDPYDRELLNRFVLQTISIPALRSQSIPLYEQIIERYPVSTKTINNHLEPISSLLITAARLRFEQGEAAQAKQHVERFLEINSQLSARYTGDRSLIARRGHLEDAASLYLRGGAIDDAFEMMRQAARIEVGNNQSNPSQAAFVNARMLQLIQQKPLEEQYQFLHEWVMPENKNGTPQLITIPVSDQQVPAIFAEVIPGAGENGVVNLQGYGPIGQVVGTGTMLVSAAKKLDRLDELMSEIKPMQEANRTGAAYLWGLCLIEQRDPEIVSLLKKQTKAYQEATAENVNFSQNDLLRDLVLVSGALHVPEALSANLELIRTMTDYSHTRRQLSVLPELHVVRAHAVRQSWQDVRPDLLAAAHPADWASLNDLSAEEHLRGGGSGIWFTFDGHLQHIGGAHDAGIVFRYPLAGDYTVRAELYDGGWAESEMAFGGVVHKFPAWSATGTLYANGQYGSFKRPNMFRNRPNPGFFFRHSVKSTPAGAVHLMNGHPLFEDSHVAESPWLSFRSAATSNSVIKRASIQGDPVIPREVRLSDSPLMRGWISRFYNETRPPALYEDAAIPLPKLQQEAAKTSLDWRWEEGAIIGRKQPASQAISTASESRLYYERPLFSGDRLSWEFDHKAGESLVHPALGRLVLLLRPAGVRLHWMTDGENDPTGLPVDHELEDAAGRRGPEQLPLKEGWNAAEIQLEGELVRLSLNGETVYERVLDFTSDRTFSFFHFKDRTQAKVRNVVLSGDWPETLPQELRENLLAPQADDLQPVDRYSLAMTLGADILQFDAMSVYRESLALPDEQRYDFLLPRVLPEPHQPFWQVSADYTPTKLPPPAQQKFSTISRLSSKQTVLDPQTGGILVSPAIELVATANRLDRLEELRARIDKQFASDSPLPKRGKQTLLLLCDLAAGDFEAANQALFQLDQTLTEVTAKLPPSRWPSLIAASQGMLYDETRRASYSLLQNIVTNQINNEQSGGWEWDHHVRGLRGIAQFLELTGGDGSRYGNPPKLSQWQPTVHVRGDALDMGVPWAQWERIDDAVHHFVGNERDYLFFQSPLMGDFTVEAYLTSFGWREVILQYGDRWVELNYQKTLFKVGNATKTLESINIDPPFEDVDDGYQYRLEVKGDRYTAFINDRKIHEGDFDPIRDPWLGLRTHSSYNGFAREVKITGNPVIPDEIKLSGNPTLAGWVATKYRESIGASSSDWSIRGEEIYGKSKPETKGMYQESLLQYQRPLTFDCELKYEFQYAKGKMSVHPALGPLAFLIKPEGVRLHWLTNGRFNLAGIDPTASFAEPANERFEGKLPLKEEKHNQMKLVLKGDQLQLFLNAQLIFERKLEPDHLRTFGLFHYAGEGIARVRNVTLKGDWPKELPSLEQQELAKSSLLDRAMSIASLKQTYEIDFTKEDRTADRFNFAGNNEQVSRVTEGLNMVSPGKDGWSQVTLNAKCAIRGDFDITATFRDLKLEAPGKKYKAMGALHLSLADSPGEAIRIGRTIDGENKQIVDGLYSYHLPDGKAKYLADYVLNDSLNNSTAGTFRIVRRGSVVHFLFAPADSTAFETISTRVIHDGPIARGGLQLRAVAGAKGTETSVIWTELKIAADEIDWK